MLCSAPVALVCELVAGMPVLVPVAVVPVCAVVVLGVVEAVAVPLGVAAVGAVAEAVAVPLGVVVEAEVLGVVEAVALTLPVALGVVVVLPAVVAGPVAEADVPGAEALVLPVAEAVPVWDDAPEAVVVLPGAVDDVLGMLEAEVLGVVEADALGVVEVDEVVELMPAEVLLGVVLEAEVVLSAVGKLAEPAALQLPIARILWPTCAVRSCPLWS